MGMAMEINVDPRSIEENASLVISIKHAACYIYSYTSFFTTKNFWLLRLLFFYQILVLVCGKRAHVYNKIRSFFSFNIISFRFVVVL